MLIENKNQFFLKKLSFFNIWYFLEMKFKIINILLMFKFIKYSNFYLVMSNLNLFADVEPEISSRIPDNKFFYKKYVFKKVLQQKFRRLFFLNNIYKKKKILAIVFKKRNGGFKRFDLIKYGLFRLFYTKLRSYHRRFFTKNFYNTMKEENLLELLNNNYEISTNKRKTNIFSIKNELKAARVDLSQYIQNTKKKKKYFKFIKYNRPVNTRRRFNTILYRNRLILQNLFFYKKVKQHKITKFIESFKNYRGSNFFVKLQSTLFMILIFSRFFFFKSDSLIYIKKYGVYLNGAICKLAYKIVNPGDTIQLVIISSYYIYLKKNMLAYDLFYKKYLKVFSKYRIKYLKKKAPNWVHKLTNFNADVFSFLEVDFTTLSIFYLYNPKVLQTTNIVMWRYVSVFLFRTYNWRKLS